MEKALSEIEQKIATLNRKQQNGRAKPHKLFMLLAVLDLAEAGLLPENKIVFNDELVARFTKFFQAGCDDSDWLQAGPPFFHLKSSGFWCHKPKEGREEQYKAIDRVGGGSRIIRENIEYAFLSPEMFSIIGGKTKRQNLFDFITTLFPSNVAQKLKSCQKPLQS